MSSGTCDVSHIVRIIYMAELNILAVRPQFQANAIKKVPCWTFLCYLSPATHLSSEWEGCGKEEQETR